MASLLESLTQQLGGDTLRELSRKLGTDESTASTAIGAALPALVGALATNASSAGGAAALPNALHKDHDGSVLDDLPGMLSSFQSGAGAGILSHVLGGKHEAVVAGVGQVSGLKSSQAGSLLGMLAPIVLGALGKAQRAGGLDAGGLATMLGAERAQPGAPTSGGLGSLLSTVDANHDGSVVDDIGNMIGKLFNR